MPLLSPVECEHLEELIKKHTESDPSDQLRSTKPLLVQFTSQLCMNCTPFKESVCDLGKKFEFTNIEIDTIDCCEVEVMHDFLNKKGIKRLPAFVLYGDESIVCVENATAEKLMQAFKSLRLELYADF